jgi:hypothetical protein
VCPSGIAQHVLNRGNGRRTIFHKNADYQAFLRLMREAQQRTPLALLAYCLTGQSTLRRRTAWNSRCGSKVA